MRPTPKVKAVDQKSHKLLAVPDASTKAQVVPPVVDPAKPSIVKLEVDYDLLEDTSEPPSSSVVDVGMAEVLEGSVSKDAQALIGRIAQPASVRPSLEADSPDEVACNPVARTSAPTPLGWKTLALLSLKQTSQGLMLLTNVSNPTDELSARPIVAHEERCMLELKFLLHKQGFGIRIFQEGVES